MVHRPKRWQEVHRRRHRHVCVPAWEEHERTELYDITKHKRESSVATMLHNAMLAALGAAAAGSADAKRLVGL